MNTEINLQIEIIKIIPFYFRFNWNSNRQKDDFPSESFNKNFSKPVKQVKLNYFAEISTRWHSTKQRDLSNLILAPFTAGYSWKFINTIRRFHFILLVCLVFFLNKIQSKTYNFFLPGMAHPNLGRHMEIPEKKSFFPPNLPSPQDYIIKASYLIYIIETYRQHGFPCVSFTIFPISHLYW